MQSTLNASATAPAGPPCQGKTAPGNALILLATVAIHQAASFARANIGWATGRGNSAPSKPSNVAGAMAGAANKLAIGAYKEVPGDSRSSNGPEKLCAAIEVDTALAMPFGSMLRRGASIRSDNVRTANVALTERAKPISAA